MTDKAACEECLAELMLKAFTSLITHAPSTAIDGALGIRAVRYRDVPRSSARHRPAARHGPLSELCGVRGAAEQFNPWARSDQRTASHSRQQQLAGVEASGASRSTGEAPFMTVLTPE